MSPKIISGILTDQEREQITEARTSTRIRSRLECFKVTNGLRPGEFSVLVGKQGNGKSGLCKTILAEAAVNGVNSLCILSEEKSSVYRSSIVTMFERGTDNASPFLDKIYFDSMLEWAPEEKTMEFLFDHMEEQIRELDLDLLILDNFTTSFLGGLHINIQGIAIDNIRKLAATYNIPILGVFHTAKGTDIYSRVLDGEDVRGNATSTNAGAYNYILTTYFRAKPPRAILFIDKARYHPEANKTYWELVYDQEAALYSAASEITYDDVKEIVDECSGRKKKKEKDGGTPKWTGYT